MESAQPCGSFKMRGMGLAAERAVQAGATGLISSSGGNAGYAVAWAGRALGVPVTVVVPSTTGQRMQRLLREAGAEVRVEGSVWDEAHEAATALAQQTGQALMHPFDHPDIWEGHASLIDEVASLGVKPSQVVVAVGGGGLLCGVVQGLQAHGWSDVPVVAVETAGAASYAASVRADRLVTLDGITTIAVTLGARQVAERALAWSRVHPIVPVVVSDRAAVRACDRFLDDHRVLVEPSCGAGLSVAYDGHASVAEGEGPLLVVVCGGAAVTRDQLHAWVAAHGG